MSIILDGQSIYIRFFRQTNYGKFSTRNKIIISGIEYRRISNNQHLKKLKQFILS